MNVMDIDGHSSRVASVVAALLANPQIEVTNLPNVIDEVDRAMRRVGTDVETPAPARRVPAVRPDKSVRQDGIVSLIDGKTYKSLRRHVGIHGFTPDSYRAEFGLAADYPMVCADYSARRSDLARKSRLGHKA